MARVAGMRLPAKAHDLAAKVLLALIAPHAAGAVVQVVWLKSGVMERISPESVLRPADRPRMRDNALSSNEKVPDMRPFIPRRFEHIAFGLLLSCFMSLLISGVSTILATGMAPGVVGTWLTSWLSSWAIAFPTVLVVAPFVRRVLHRLVLPDPP